jgi:hypothetical protein
MNDNLQVLAVPDLDEAYVATVATTFITAIASKEEASVLSSVQPFWDSIITDTPLLDETRQKDCPTIFYGNLQGDLPVIVPDFADSDHPSRLPDPPVRCRHVRRICVSVNCKRTDVLSHDHWRAHFDCFLVLKLLNKLS